MNKTVRSPNFFILNATIIKKLEVLLTTRVLIRNIKLNREKWSNVNLNGFNSSITHKIV
jgi:hypothetical protein